MILSTTIQTKPSILFLRGGGKGGGKKAMRVSTAEVYGRGDETAEVCLLEMRWRWRREAAKQQRGGEQTERNQALHKQHQRETERETERERERGTKKSRGKMGLGGGLRTDAVWVQRRVNVKQQRVR
jgi:hypothetical protein